ncbi:MAG: methyltransferase [Kordiimonadales bacterium]|nr:MAG: methyltransferase [Kordiimonadales bacterium]
MSFWEGAITDVWHKDFFFQFFVVSGKAVIQQALLKGHLYEKEELELLTPYVPENATILDIGANLGVHTIYYDKVLNAKKIIPFEPNPPAIKLLKINLKLNGCQVADTSFLGCGVGAKAATGFAIKNPTTYADGRTFIIEDGEGPINIITIDETIEEPIDFVKIDVEGMELEVLDGMKKTIDQYRPAIFVEVNNENKSRFTEFVAEIEYSIKESFKRYPENCNYLIAPI